MESFNIGIDLGGTKTEVVLLQPGGTERYRERVSTPGDNEYTAIVKMVCDLIIKTRRSVSEQSTCTIGIGIPGTIDSEKQVIQNANITCLKGRSFQKDIEKKLRQPVTIENDASCFTLAESLLGATKTYRLIFGVIMGTGCGGSICFNGRIIKGSHGIAGEWGHFSVDPNGDRCYCGNVGCIETKISGSGVEGSFFKKYARRLRMHEIVEGYRNKDPQCVNAFNRFVEDFGRCLGGLVSILDPDAIVLGGGLSNIHELYDQGVKYVKQYAFHNGIDTPIIRNRLGDSAGVLGAALIGAGKSME